MLDAWLVALVALRWHSLRRSAWRCSDPQGPSRHRCHAGDVKRARGSARASFQQLQSLLSLERLSDLPKASPATCGWAVRRIPQPSGGGPGPCAGHHHECGSGVSTLVAARCVDLNGRGHVYSLEHDPAYAAQTRGLLSKHGLSGRATSSRRRSSSVPMAPAGIRPRRCRPTCRASTCWWWTGRRHHRQARQIPALRQLRDRMNAAFTVLVDDADRDDEREMIRRWRAEDTMLDEVRSLRRRGSSFFATPSPR